MLNLREHADWNYVPRTTENAESADLTVAFAVDFSTAGERLTKKVSNGRYVAICLSWDVLTSARHLFSVLRRMQVKRLNIAGNGIYTLSEHGWTQESIDEHIFQIIKLCHAHWPIEFIRSGGQTGVDEAGLVAACALNIPAEGLYPKGFRQRLANNQDVKQKPDTLRTLIEQRASTLQQRHNLAHNLE